MESRTEDILKAMIDGTDSSELAPPQSRVEELLQQLMDHIDGGGSGGGGGGLSIHVCTSSEYNATTRVPTISSPDASTLYLVPGESAVTTDLYVEWMYINNTWEKIGSATIDAHGIPSGGTTGQILKKSSNTDYAASWSNNTLSGLSDVFTQFATFNSILMYNPSSSNWVIKTINENTMYFEDDGEGHVVLYASEGEIENRFWSGIPFCAHGSLDGVTECQLHFLMRRPEFDEWDMLLRETVYFINLTTSTPYNLDIVRFVGEWIEGVDWQYRYQPAAATTHEVSHTWIGTQAEYTALGTYDPNTIYYIRE